MFLGKSTIRFVEQQSFLPPADFQGNLASGFYVLQGFDGNLVVFPGEAFENLYQSLRTQNIADPQVRMLMRLMLGTAEKLEANEQGMITIPQALKEHASLNGSALLVGQGDYFEIWEPRAWEKQENQLNNPELNSTRFSNLVITTHSLVNQPADEDE